MQITIVKEQLELFVHYTIQHKQPSLIDYSASSAAAARRANAASGSSLKYGKILREPFLIV